MLSHINKAAILYNTKLLLRKRPRKSFEYNKRPNCTLVKNGPTKVRIVSFFANFNGKNGHFERLTGSQRWKHDAVTYETLDEWNAKNAERIDDIGNVKLYEAASRKKRELEEERAKAKGCAKGDKVVHSILSEWIDGGVQKIPVRIDDIGNVKIYEKQAAEREKEKLAQSKKRKSKKK